MKREETIDFNIKAAWHAIYRMYNQQAGKHNMTITMAYVLINLDIDHGTQATKIAPLMGMEARSLTRVLKSMEEKELIYKRRDENDRRSVRIFLTEKGKEKNRIAKEKVKTFNSVIKDFIPKEKLDTFFEVINAVNRLIDQNHIFQPAN